MPERRPRVVLGMAETAGYLGNLQRGFEEIGCTCHFIDLAEHPFGYERVAALPGPARWRTTLTRRLSRLPRRSLRRSGLRVATLLIDLVIFGWAVGHADLFIFTGHDSLLWRNTDLPLLRLLHKRVVWVFLGSDHRPPYLNGKRVRGAGEMGQRELAAMAELARTTRTVVRRIERRADVVVAMSASAHFHGRPFVHLLAIGIPHPTPEGGHALRSRPGSGAPIQVLHSPTDPAKGSEAIRACVVTLEATGLALEYREVTGRPHGEVLDAIEEADLVIDQVYSDSPLAVFATEAGYRGRAVVVGGYYASVVADDVPADLIPPSHFVSPEQLCQAVDELARDPGKRQELGAGLSRFVRERWSSTAVAERYLRLASGPPPAEWLYDPARLRYVHGWGLAEGELQTFVSRLVATCGREALGLDHNPALRDRLLALATSAGAAP